MKFAKKMASQMPKISRQSKTFSLHMAIDNHEFKTIVMANIYTGCFTIRQKNLQEVQRAQKGFRM